MAVLELSCVVRDGSGDMVPTPQRLALVRGETTVISFRVTTSDGSPYDLTGKTVVFGVRPPKTSIGTAAGTALLARKHAPVDVAGGKGTFTVTRDDTVNWQERRTYRCDVQLIDDATEERQQIVAESDLWLDPIVYLPSDVASGP